jgi:hypothetical protein
MSLELAANLAEAAKQFSHADDECDVVLLRKSPDGKAEHLYRNRECCGTSWYPWHPHASLVDFDHIRMILVDRGWGWTTEYCPHTRLHTFTVIVRLHYYTTQHKDYRVAGCEALLKALLEEEKLEMKNEGNRRPAERVIIKRDLHADPDDNDPGSCRTDDEGCSSGRGGCSCSPKNADDDVRGTQYHPVKTLCKCATSTC